MDHHRAAGAGARGAQVRRGQLGLGVARRAVEARRAAASRVAVGAAKLAADVVDLIAVGLERVAGLAVVELQPDARLGALYGQGISMAP